MSGVSDFFCLFVWWWVVWVQAPAGNTLLDDVMKRWDENERKNTSNAHVWKRTTFSVGLGPAVTGTPSPAPPTSRSRNSSPGPAIRTLDLSSPAAAGAGATASASSMDNKHGATSPVTSPSGKRGVCPLSLSLPLGCVGLSFLLRRAVMLRLAFARHYSTCNAAPFQLAESGGWRALICHARFNPGSRSFCFPWSFLLHHCAYICIFHRANPCSRIWCYSALRCCGSTDSHASYDAAPVARHGIPSRSSCRCHQSGLASYLFLFIWILLDQRIYPPCYSRFVLYTCRVSFARVCCFSLHAPALPPFSFALVRLPPLSSRSFVQ
jgi:hypothetical protein